MSNRSLKQYILDICRINLGKMAYMDWPMFNTAVPIIDGTAAVGTQLTAARSDHVHPSDTTKCDLSTSQTLTNKIFTGVTINGQIINNTWPGTLGVNGTVVSLTNGADAMVWGNLAYISGNGIVRLASCTAAATTPAMYMALGTYSASQANCLFLRTGIAQNNSWTMGAGNVQYLWTAGGMTASPPGTTGYQIQIIGVALSSNLLDFCPCSVTAECA